MNFCIHRRISLDTQRSHNDPTFIARIGAVMIMLRLVFLLFDSGPNMAALSCAFSVITLLASADLLVNDLMPDRFHLRRTKRMRFLIYMAASIATGIAAFYAAELFPHTFSFTAGYVLISVWMMVLAARDLVHQINKDML